MYRFTLEHELALFIFALECRSEICNKTLACTIEKIDAVKAGGCIFAECYEYEMDWPEFLEVAICSGEIFIILRTIRTATIKEIMRNFMTTPSPVTHL